MQKLAFTLATSATFVVSSLVAYADTAFQLNVQNSPRSNYTKNDINDIIGYMHLVAADTTKGGVDCRRAKFRLNSLTQGTESKFDTIDNSAELGELLNSTDANVFVVRRILYCGRPRPDGRVAGCASPNGNMVVRNEFPSVREGVLWLHEFGHTQDLSWKTESTPHSSEVNSFMRPSLGDDHTVVSSKECEYLAVDSDRFPSATLVADAKDNIEAADEELEDDEFKDLIALLDEIWSHEVPYGEIRELSQAELNHARKLLLSWDQRRLWANAVVVIGVIGEPSDILLLRYFLERDYPDKGVIEEAILAVPFAIGYISARHETAEGIEFLQQAVNPNRNIGLAGETLDESEYIAREFSKSALLGLAIQPEVSSAAAIDDARNSQEKGAYDLEVDEGFFELLEAIQDGVAAGGLEGYFERQTSP